MSEGGGGGRVYTSRNIVRNKVVSVRAQRVGARVKCVKATRASVEKRRGGWAINIVDVTIASVVLLLSSDRGWVGEL